MTVIFLDFYQNIAYIYFRYLSWVVLERCPNQTLVGRPSVFQTKWHDSIAKEIMLCDEVRSVVIFIHWDIIILNASTMIAFHVHKFGVRNAPSLEKLC